MCIFLHLLLATLTAWSKCNNIHSTFVEHIVIVRLFTDILPAAVSIYFAYLYRQFKNTYRMILLYELLLYFIDWFTEFIAKFYNFLVTDVDKYILHCCLPSSAYQQES